MESDLYPRGWTAGWPLNVNTVRDALGEVMTRQLSSAQHSAAQHARHTVKVLR
jgi:hypothetical protein